MFSISNFYLVGGRTSIALLRIYRRKYEFTVFAQNSLLQAKKIFQLNVLLHT